MARGKKSKGTHYVSKGERPNVNKKTRNAVRLDTTPLERHRNQQNAWLKGKNVMVTIPNPNTNETNKRFIRVPASEVWKTVRRK